jgi:hypothetical protein
MSFYYGQASTRPEDVFKTIKQYLAANGTALSAVATLPGGEILSPAVSFQPRRNLAIVSFSDGLEMVVHSDSITETETTFDGRQKSLHKFRFSLAAYGQAGIPELDAALAKIGDEYANDAVIESSYSSYAAYAAAIGDTTNGADVYSNFVSARTCTLKVGKPTIGGVARDSFSIDDVEALVKASAVDSRVALNTDPAIYADGVPASADPGGTGGWYYTNAGDGTKINWYFLGVYPGAPDQTLIGDIRNMFMTFYPRTADTQAPFVALYTMPQNDGFDAAPWYRSRLVYSTSAQSWTANYPVLIYLGDEEPTVEEGMPRSQLSLDGISSLGPMSPDEDIYLASVGTDSSVAAGDYNFATTKVGYDSRIDGRVVTNLIGIG